MSQHDALVRKRDSSGRQSTTGFTSLDPEIHRESYVRLSWAGLAYAAGYASAFGIWLLLQGSPTGSPDSHFIVAGFSILLGLLVFALCRRRLIPVRGLTRAAFAFEVLGAFGINGGMWGWQMYLPPDSPVTGIPWVCPWILTFPTIIPAAPRHTLMAGLAAAASVPIVMTLSLVQFGAPPGGAPEQTARFILALSYPAVISAGLAYWIAILFYGLSREASKARRLGSYQLTERIGAGGMGEVWKAKHRLLARPGAIKLIRPETLGGDEATRMSAVKRFEREAQATAALGSPHTIELYDFGMTDDGTFYYVMELLEGLDLQRLVERFGPVPQERAIHLLRQACHSLHDAHLSGMVHRDIKPGNIFACRRGHDYDFVKVLDFGLVAATQTDAGQTHLTVEGVVSGTPAFMAPEVVSGERGPDPRVDIYALGCVGYWLLTGELVFSGNTPMAVLVQHVKDSPTPPSVRSEMPIHSELERVILSCLEKDPSNRPKSSEVLSARLAACQLEVPEWTNERAAVWWRAHLPEIGPSTPSHDAESASAMITVAIE